MARTQPRSKRPQKKTPDDTFTDDNKCANANTKQAPSSSKTSDSADITSLRPGANLCTGGGSTTDSMTGEISPSSGSGRSLLDLPGEIRLVIYQCILPSGRMFTYIPWTIDSDRNITWKLVLKDVSPNDHLEEMDEEFIVRGLPGVELLQVCREIRNEARAAINESNTFLFSTTSVAEGSHLLGPYGDPIHLPLLRHMRNIRVDLNVDTNFRTNYNRITKQNLEYMVKMFKLYFHDQATQRPLLRCLHIHIDHCPKLQALDDYRNEFVFCHCREFISKVLFSLEHLEALRGINEVLVTGIDGWFGWYARCVELWLQGKGGDVEEMEWPTVRVKQRRYGRDATWVKKPVMTEWYHPKFDWRKFARRNGIALPADVDELFTLTTITPR